MAIRGLTTLSALLAAVHADVYMHNPRGSNDRNCERNANRDNGNRLFNSQNNAAGGYACPRAVGDETVQNEDGEATFSTFKQSKRMYYYEGSWLPIEWTNQHGCGVNSEVNCEIVLQYMCEDTADPQVDNFWPYVEGKNNKESVNTQHFRAGQHIGAPRDGVPRDSNDAATDTIPDNVQNAIPDSVEDRRFGMHESYDYYQLCQRTERNKGLYTADQKVRRNDQRATRQNPNGNRNGLECPEERDYYPWWHPSPWVDIAVLSNEAGAKPCSSAAACSSQRCRFYLQNSFNTAKKGYCDVRHDGSSNVADKTGNVAWQQNRWHNNRAACEAAGFVWYEVSLQDNLTGLAAPVCAHTQYSRVNHLGNSWDPTVTSNISRLEPQGLNANRFMWKVPTIPQAKVSASYFKGSAGNGMEDAYKSCVLRIRYNISTSDYPAWPKAAMESTHPWYSKMVTAANNSRANSDANTPVTQDPFVFVGPGDSESAGAQFLYVRANTNQYGRTFQDRSYKFSIRPRPSVASAANADLDTPYTPALSYSDVILNVNVRGKRGNIVQTYPAVEYGFIPDQLALDKGNYIHFQWTGSDYNPRRGCNDANGGPPDANDFISATNAEQNARADRSNVIFTEALGTVTPLDMIGTTHASFEALSFESAVALAMNATLSDSPCYITAGDASVCYAQMMRLAYLNQQSDGGAIELRRGKKCLTLAQLNEIADQDTARTHPLNCATMSAKPYPYFDGGLFKARRPGRFSFFSSRNNNFSNRDQKAVLCIRGTLNGVTYTCPVDSNTTNLVAYNPASSTAAQRAATARCVDTQNDGRSATSDGATSCLSQAMENDILTGATSTIFAQNNDAYGQGNRAGCLELSLLGKLTRSQRTGLLAGLLFLLGLIIAFCGFYGYNRYRAHKGLLPRPAGTTSSTAGNSIFNQVRFGGRTWRRQRANEGL